MPGPTPAGEKVVALPQPRSPRSWPTCHSSWRQVSSISAPTGSHHHTQLFSSGPGPGLGSAQARNGFSRERGQGSREAAGARLSGRRERARGGRAPFPPPPPPSLRSTRADLAAGATAPPARQPPSALAPPHSSGRRCVGGGGGGRTGGRRVGDGGGDKNGRCEAKVLVCERGGRAAGLAASAV